MDRVERLTDADVHAMLVSRLMERSGVDEATATAAVERWQGDHDYSAWQRGYQEAMIFASNLLLDASQQPGLN